MSETQVDWLKLGREHVKKYQELNSAVDSKYQSMGLDGLRARIRELGGRMEQPDFWNDADRAREVSQEKSNLEKKLQPWDALRSESADNGELLEMALEEEDTDATRSLVTAYDRLAEEFDRLELLGVLTEPEDAMNAFVTIQPGAGGTESMDWADMLHRMYVRWIEKKGWKVTILDFQPGDQAGIKNVVLQVRGENAFGLLKSENGIHRLVRLSPFDSAKRRHTSFVSVHISPELDDSVAVEVNETEIRVDTYRSSGAGGQHVNTTDSAIRITHIPTGIVVQCQNERSQIKNRDTAMKMLKSRLLELERQKKQDEMAAKSGEKKDIGWGSQIRSYVFHPYNMVKDHRTEFETGNVDAVMNGELDPFIFAYLRWKAEGSSRASVEE